jgi:hypothetical protein
VANVDDMRKTGDAKRVTLLISLLHRQRVEARDEVVTMFCKRMAALHKKGRERLEELREAHRAESERLIGVFGEVLAGAREATAPAEAGQSTAPAAGDVVVGVDVAERAGRLLLKTLDAAGGLEELSLAHEAVSAYHGNNYLPLLEGFYRSHRPALFTLVDALEMTSTTADRSVLDAVEFIRANRDRRSEWIPQTTVHTREEQQVTVTIDVDAFATVAWRKVLRHKDQPGMLARRHLEVCVFSHLAAELRSGDIAVAGSDSYADLGAQLMSWEECAPLAAQFCEQAGIPTEASELVVFYRRELATTAARVDEGTPPTSTWFLRKAARCSSAAEAPTGGRPHWRWSRRFTSAFPSAACSTSSPVPRTSPGGIAISARPPDPIRRFAATCSAATC